MSEVSVLSMEYAATYRRMSEVRPQLDIAQGKRIKGVSFVQINQMERTSQDISMSEVREDNHPQVDYENRQMPLLR